MTEGFLPGLLGEFSRLTTVEAALAIADKVGGLRVYIPENAGDDHWLVQSAGRLAADAIMREYAGRRLDIPLGPHAGMRGRLARQFRDLQERGASEAQIAAALGYTQRGVRKKRAKARQAANEPLPLFGGDKKTGGRN